MKERLHGFIMQGHADDRAHTEGADAALAAAGVRLSYVTFTDGGARKLPKYPDKAELVTVRRDEDERQTSLIGGKGRRLYSAGFPDGYLFSYRDPAIDFLTSVVQEDKPDFFIAPHILDPHDDHSETAQITLAVAGDIPVYLMDTPTGEDKFGKNIKHTHFIPLTRNEVRRGRKAFRLNKSQTYDLPQGERKAVFDVMGMPKRVAEELKNPDISYAAALTLVDFSLGDPLIELLGTERVIVNREMLTTNV